jgi:CubicO group peptidase (beta-lactamase class C family)
MNPTKSIILIAMVLISNPCVPQSNQEATQSFTGYATSLVTADTIFASKCIGYANLESRIPYTLNTTQAIGSVSKTVIGIALMKAVEEGYFSLDEDINNLLPFRVTNPYHPYQIITLRNLATHTSGIRDRKITYYLKCYQKGDTTTIGLEEFLKNYFTPHRRYYSRRNFNKSKPGQTYDYSNIAATLAAYVIEYNTHMKYDVFTTRYIFRPLKMDSTFWFYNTNNASHRAIPYSKQNKPIKPYSLITYPDGGLKTNIVNLSLYLQELIRAYQGRSIILKTASWLEIFTPQFKSNQLPEQMDVKETNAGLFFTFRDHHLIGHTGSDPGVCTMLFFDYQNGTGKIFMANKELNKHNQTTFQKIWKDQGK